MIEEILYLGQLIIAGLSIGALYGLIGLGFVLIFKATDILNFAQGEAMMVGAYFCYVMMINLHVPFYIAIILTILFLVLVGAVTDSLVIHPLFGESILSIVMVTLGLSIFLKAVITIIFGSYSQLFPSPFPDESIAIVKGLFISYTQLWILLCSGILVTVFFLVFKYSKMGLAMRATANDQEASYLMGVNIKRIFAQTWGISFVVAGVGGVFLANLMSLSPDLSIIAIRVFPAIVLGGMESVPGAIIGGLIIGLAENIVGGYFDERLGGGTKDITGFVILFLLLIIKPYGLFGIKKIERV
ncbi:MAG: branched-chain amino acid ABC transporter permease [Thermodesulfobacteriota bacterium]|nr:branched-chain amino acid ABC transporter permease [Thermodesulfobacteriota bacterium]